jgi:quercetin 2,3-dioxygenase
VIIIRKADSRGQTKTEWLQSFHTFSFANYYDPQFLGFGNLLVINEDTVKPGFGFGLHNHEDMEIITYVIEGSIQHKDSTGQTSILKRGEIQRMSAGTGIRHSEINPSSTTPLHFLQIWILPRKLGLTPSYEQKNISQKHNQLIPIGSPEGEENTVKIHQDVNLYSAYNEEKNSIGYSFEQTNYGWLQIVKGNVVLNEEVLRQGDGAAIIDENKIQIESLDQTEFLLFDFEKPASERVYEERKQS